MGIDIVYIGGFQSSPGKGLAHSQESPFTILGRSRLMEGVTSVSKSGKPGQGLNPTLDGAFSRFQNQICRPFAQIESGAGGIERTARLPVQDHQGIEAVQVVAAQAFAASHNYPFALSGTDEIGAKDNGIGGR